MRSIRALLGRDTVQPVVEDVQDKDDEVQGQDADRWDDSAVGRMTPRWETLPHGNVRGMTAHHPLGSGVVACAAAPPAPMPLCSAPRVAGACPAPGGRPRPAMAARKMAAPMAAAAIAPSFQAECAIGFKTGGAQDAANFRENIRQGHLPVPTDVTFEGLIKDYFFDTTPDTSDAEPCTELFCPTYSLALAPDPLLAAAAASREEPPPPQEVFLAVGLDSGITDFRRPRLNLVILLDISGSMSCPFDSHYYDPASGQQRVLTAEDARRSKLDVAKEVVKGMLGRLGPEDSVAITLFNTGAASPKRMGRWGSADAAGIRAGLDGLHAHGGTNFQAGLEEAASQLRGHADCIDGDPATTENRIIVLTDAETNSGDISEQGLLARLKANAADRFYTTIVGVGLDFNTQLVEGIMKVRGANYFSVHTPGEFRQRLEGEFDFMVAPLVFDLELRVDPGSLGAQQAQQADQAPTDDEGGTAVPVGLDAGQEALLQEAREEGWELAEGGAEGGAAPGGGGGDAQPPAPQAAAPSAAADQAVPAGGGWKVVHVHSSPDSEERRFLGGGSVMWIHTLFPHSSPLARGICKDRGGHQGQRGAAEDAAPRRVHPRHSAAASPCSDRAGKQYNTLRAVQLPVAADAATPIFQSSCVAWRKAVALARLVDALHAWSSGWVLRWPMWLWACACTTQQRRTNTAYQRFDEAREMWGLMVNRSRYMIRQALGYIPDSQPELQEMFCCWVVAVGRSLQCHLRASENLERELLGKLPPKELQALLAATHRPNFCKFWLRSCSARLPSDLPANTCATANVKASAFVRMDEHLTVFAGVTGGCKCILRTPVLLSYSHHTSRALTIWLTFMPFSLWDKCGWYTVPVTLLFAFLLLGIKEIGFTVEEPFSILPLERICDTIEGNVWELHSAHSADAAGEARRKRRQGDALASMDAEDLVGMAMTRQLA